MLVFVFDTAEEKEKFEYMYEKYKRLMLFHANKILHDLPLAEDAVSEAFFRVYKNIHKIDDADSGTAVSFLMAITKNCAINILNKNKGNTVYDENESMAMDFDLEKNVASNMVTEAMLSVIDRLKDELKSCFLLMYAYDMSYKEIGQALGISENNVTVRIHRAKKKIIELLEKEGLV